MEGLRWSQPGQWHVTLRFFGELAERELEVATQALRRVAAGLAGPLTAQGGPWARFLGPGLVVWPVEGLALAARATERATARLGQAPPARKFLGHLTLARARTGVDLRRAPQLLAPLAMTWPVTSLTLVQSQLHPEGARYRVVDSFPLARDLSQRPSS